MNETAPRPVWDEKAEQALLGACLLGKPDLIETCLQILPDPDAFHNPRNAKLWADIVELHTHGTNPDLVTVPHHRRATGQTWTNPDDLWLADLYHDAPPTPQITYYANILLEHTRRRGLETALLRLQATLKQDLTDGQRQQRIEQLGHELLDRIDQTTGHRVAGDGSTAATLRGHTPRELDQYLATDDPPYDWLIPGLLEHQDRVILTGGEGSGKSTLLRQVGLQLAAGIHPFTLQPLPPLRILIIDLENTETQTRRKLRALRIQADTYTPTPGLHIQNIPEGIDLLDPETARQLLALTIEQSPDVIITGPLYKMHSGDPTEEQPAKTVASWLDRIRVNTGAALIIETHSPHPPPGRNAVRPTRPYGASLWMRWPEFGIHIGEHGQLTHWRGQRDQRAWPAVLRRGGRWPWTVDPDTIAELQTREPDRPLPAVDPIELVSRAARRLIRALDLYQIPSTWGRDRVRRELLRHEIAAGTHELAEAITWRRENTETEPLPRDEDPTLFDEGMDGRGP